MSQTAKLQRWIDLVTALLARHHGATLGQLVDEVPGYQRKTKVALRRTFERDKDELRRLGVPITTHGTEGDAEMRYLLPAAQFYLPYLALATHRGTRHPKRVDRFGYRALQEFAFTEHELELLADAAARVQSFGDPVLAADARAALDKLAVDVHHDALAPTPGVAVLPPRPAADGDTLTRLGDALLRRKQVTFTYYGMERDETERRVVLPYGLAFTSGHWYLHAQDPARGAVRRFRVSRLRELEVNTQHPGTQDYEIPGGFGLAQRAISVPPWALGDDVPVLVELAFRRANGYTQAARRLGRAVQGTPDRVQYDVRRREPFHRWVLGLAGDAVITSPPDMVRQYQALMERTLATATEATS